MKSFMNMTDNKKAKKNKKTKEVKKNKKTKEVKVKKTKEVKVKKTKLLSEEEISNFNVSVDKIAVGSSEKLLIDLTVEDKEEMTKKQLVNLLMIENRLMSETVDKLIHEKAELTRENNELKKTLKKIHERTEDLETKDVKEEEVVKEEVECKTLGLETEIEPIQLPIVEETPKDAKHKHLNKTVKISERVVKMIEEAKSDVGVYVTTFAARGGEVEPIRVTIETNKHGKMKIRITNFESKIVEILHGKSFEELEDIGNWLILLVNEIFNRN